MSIEQRFRDIKSAIPGHVRLVAVSKRQPTDVIQEAYQLGLRDFAENYQQEATEKQSELKSLEIDWHFIGSIQSKKLKKLVGHFQFIHSVERLSVLEQIDSISKTLSIRQKVLIQLNVASENSKSGLKVEDLDLFFEQASQFGQVEICGLMLMPPFVDHPEENRAFFRQGRECLIRLAERFSFLDRSRFKELSMGTSQDYLVAIQEGATMVRIGTQLLGERKN